MTELLLICAVGALGVAFATTVARWLLGRVVGDHDLERAAAIVGSGVVRYLRRQQVVSVSVAAVVGAAVFLTFGVAYQVGVITAVSPREYGVVVTISYLLGAGLGLLVAWVAAWAGRHASARVAAGARRSLDESLQVAIRAGAVSGVVALAAALLGLAGLFLGLMIYFGGSFSATPAALAVAPRIPMMLPGFVLGAAFIALLTQLGGGIFSKVADIGADVAGQLGASLLEDDAGNPAAVADLVGDHVGQGAARAAGLFAATAIESLAAMAVAAMVYRVNEDLPSVTAIVLFPLVARTFGLLAAWFGVMVVRTDDTEVPMNALSRGLYVTTMLYAVGAVGAAKWLLGPHWKELGGCAVLGSVCSLILLYATQYYSEQKYRPVRALAEAARGGPTLAILRGLFTAAEGAFASITALLATSLAAYYVGARTGLEGGGLLGLAIAAGGLLGGAPYVLAMDAMGSIADTAGGIIEMTLAAERPDVRARARLLDAVGTTAKSYTQLIALAASSVAGFLLVGLFVEEVWESAATEESCRPDVHSPLLYVGALLGVMVILVFSWVTLRRIIVASRDLLNELRVQLGAQRARSGGPAERMAPGLVTEDALRIVGSQSSRESAAEEGQLACVEIVSRIALRGMVAPAIVGVGLPLVIGVGLRLIATADMMATSAEALAALLLVALVAAALSSLLFIHAGGAWDNAKKYIETGAHGGRYLVDRAVRAQASGVSSPALRRVAEVDNPTYVAAVIGDTVGDPLRGALGPATQALLATLIALTLVFLPFFL